jgi:hypothetical protein
MTEAITGSHIVIVRSGQEGAPFDVDRETSSTVGRRSEMAESAESPSRRVVEGLEQDSEVKTERATRPKEVRNRFDQEV